MSHNISNEFNPTDLLTNSENESLNKWRNGRDPQPLRVGVALTLFELYLNGYSCSEICKLNENIYPLGQIVDARLRHDWDRRKIEYLERLYNGVADKVNQTKLESAMFLADVLTAAHKQYGTKIKKYIQSGNDENLGNIGVGTIKDYREVLTALNGLVSADKEKTVTIKHEKVEPKESRESKVMDAEQANNLLALLEKSESDG